MNRRHAIPALKQIAAIRALQQSVAEADASSAASLVRAREDARDASQRERDKTLSGWESCLGSAAFSPEMMRSWSAGLRVRQTAVDGAQTSVESAVRERERCAGLVWRASLQSEATGKLLKQKVKARAERRAERSLSDAFDRHLYRWSAR